MRTRACPLKKQGGCGKCPGRGNLRDRMGKEFTYICFERKFGTLLNSVPLWTADKDIRNIDFITLWFTTEQPRRCEEVYRMITENRPFDEERTTGLYFRELL